MGHAPEEVGDLYSKLKEDVLFRQEWAERIGLGFELVHNGPQNVLAMKAEKVAQTNDFAVGRSFGEGQPLKVTTRLRTESGPAGARGR